VPLISTAKTPITHDERLKTALSAAGGGFFMDDCANDPGHSGISDAVGANGSQVVLERFI
jgi:hypothetical protein